MITAMFEKPGIFKSLTIIFPPSLSSGLVEQDYRFHFDFSCTGMEFFLYVIIYIFIQIELQLH